MSSAVVAQLVRAPACRRAAFCSKDGLKLSGISVEAKSYMGYANTEGTFCELTKGRRRD